ncbi:MAG: O-antigen ligase family protein [Duncaniella sp.]|nr:O-antigen ligase family protein [Duncaniella sp.]
MTPIVSMTLMSIKRLLILIFPVSVIVDLISGFCTVQLHTYIPIGQAYRFIIMAAIIYMLLKRARPLLVWMILCPISFFLLASSFWIIIHGFEPDNGFSPAIEIESFSKILYFMLVITFFILYREEIGLLDPLKIISNYGMIISSAVLISFLTGFGNSTYGADYGFGSKSYFKAGNDLGLTILYSAVVSSLYMISGFDWKRMVKLLIISSAVILIGSRVGLVGILLWLTILVCYIVFIYRPADRRIRRRFRHYRPIIFTCYILSVSGVIYYLLSAFDSYMLFKYTSVGLRTARSLLTDPAEVYISKFEWYEAVFGKGMAALYYFVAHSVRFRADYRMVEADFHELLGGYGIIGFILILSPFVYFMFKALTRYFSHPDFTLFAILFVTGSFLAVAFTAGHCLRNPMVAPIYAYIVSQLYYGKERPVDK